MKTKLFSWLNSHWEISYAILAGTSLALYFLGRTILIEQAPQGTAKLSMFTLNLMILYVFLEHEVAKIVKKHWPNYKYTNILEWIIFGIIVSVIVTLLKISEQAL